MEENKLYVRLFGKPAGILEFNHKKKMHFSYLKDATHPLSLSMPLSEKSFDHQHCYPYFAGLMPEGDKIHYSLSKMLGIDSNNTFDMLQILGYDCAGAISFHLLSEAIEPCDTSRLKGDVLSEKELAHRLQTLPQAPFFIDHEGFRMSLSGVQDKVAVCLIDGKAAMPEKGCFTTHIIKPAIAPFEELVWNEFFCMRLGQRLDLQMAEIELRKAANIDYLLIKRFDREIQGDTIKHYHQEDFCQALGIAPSHKFQKDGGPSFKGCFNLLQKTNIPAIERNRFMKMIIFNYLLGNTNAHGKNYSLIYLSPKHLQLAPFYDVTCMIGNSSNQMAMKVGGSLIKKRSMHHIGNYCVKKEAILILHSKKCLRSRSN